MPAGEAARSGEELYEVLGFSECRHARVEELSGGTRAKLNLALALLPDPELLLLAVVPVVFVALSAGAIADFARILGGQASLGQLEAATAGWAAAFLAGVATYFHVAGSREADRRLAGATVIFALIYLGIGATVGALVRSEINGSLVLIFVWMIDVFLGPAMGTAGAVLTRVFPTHFPTLVMLDASTTHAGPLGDLGASLIWAAGGLALACLALLVTTRPATIERLRPAGLLRGRLWTGLRFAWREYRRNVALWVLLVALPVFFITVSIEITPDDPAPVELAEGGRRAISILSMVDVHGALMVAITVAFLAGLAGLFVVLESAGADRRLVIAGFRPREVLGSRLGVIVLAAVLVSGVSLAVTAVSFQPAVWTTFALAVLAVAVTYAMIGVVIGPLVGRLGGLYLMFLLSFLDVGLAQNIMFDAAPPTWAVWMPAHGAVRVLVDGAFRPSFDETAGALLAAVWLVGVTATGAAVFHRLAAPHRG